MSEVKFPLGVPSKFIFIDAITELAKEKFGVDGYSIAETPDLPKRYNFLFEFSDLTKKGLIKTYPIAGCETLREVCIYHRKDNDIEYLSLESGDDEYHSLVRLIAAPKGKLWKLLHFANNQNKKELIKPVLEESVYQATIVSTLRFLKHRKRLKKAGVTANKGILIHGEPGNGKTLITSYIKNMAENMGLVVGVITEKKIAEDRIYGDVIILDDFSIDSLSKRGPVADTLLSRMDGPDKNGGKVYLITTNEVTDSNKLLPPLLRPGRIDSIVHLKQPSKELRTRYINTWKIELSQEIKNEIVNRTVGFSFAQLNHIQTELTLMSLENKNLDIDEAFKITSLKLGDEIKPASAEKTKLGFFRDEFSNMPDE